MKQVIGIDVGKASLVIYAFEKHYEIENEGSAIKEFLSKHQEKLKQIDLIVFEATGGHERVLRTCLIEKDYAYHLAHPNHVRDFAKAEGYLAKTDKLDAQVIARYGEISRKAVAEKPLPGEEVQRLKTLLDRRGQLIGEQTREKNRLHQIEDSWLKGSTERHLNWIEKELERIEKEVAEHQKQNQELESTMKLLTSIPGIGKQTARVIMAYLPELEACTDKSVAALVGVAPFNKESGKWKGKRKIKAGRSVIRNVLYMAAMTASRYNRVIKVFFERLIAKGKPYKVALTAAMRKLLLIAQSVLKRKTPWVEKESLA
jgi:transposase